MNSIIIWTVKMRKTSTIWWSIGIVAFIVLGLIFYPSFKDQAEALEKSFENLSDSVVALIGGSTDFFSPVGYMNSQIHFIMLPLLFGILTIGLGSSLLAREETDKTIESLLARPVSRGKLLLAKAAAAIIVTGIVSGVSLLSLLILAKAVGMELSLVHLTQATLVCVLMCTSFGAIAFLLTTTGRARGASLGIAALIAFGGYIIDSLASTVTWLEWPSKALPFHYYQSETILRGNYNWTNIWFFVVIIVGCGVLSWLAFRRRDLA